jgi:hypothetical protein
MRAYDIIEGIITYKSFTGAGLPGFNWEKRQVRRFPANKHTYYSMVVNCAYPKVVVFQEYTRIKWHK